MLQQFMLVDWTFTQTLMKLNSSLRLRLYNEKSDVVRPFYSMTHHSLQYIKIYFIHYVLRHLQAERKSSMGFQLMSVSMTFNDHMVAHYYIGLHDIVSAQVYNSECLRKYAYWQTDLLLSPTFLSTGAKVPEERKLKGTKVVCTVRYTGAKCPWNESSWNIRFWGGKVPGVRKFHRTKVLGLLAPRERMFHGTEVPLERKFSLWTFRSRERKCRGTKSPDTRFAQIFSSTNFVALTT